MSAMGDRREYVRVSVDLPMHPKLAAVDDPAAGWLYVVSLCYCGEHLTDGTFGMVVVSRMAGVDKEIGKRLISGGLWHEPGHDCPRCPQPPEGSLVIHDYLQHQRSRSDADRARAAGRTAAAARWSRAGRKGSASGSQSHPDATPSAVRTANGMRTAYEPHPDGGEMRTAYEPQCDSDATPNTEVEVEVEEEKYVGKSPSVGGPGGSASQQAAPPDTKRKRGTRITADWTPSPAKRASLRDRFTRPPQWWLDETEKFVNWFIQKTGRNATSLDWDARFDVWIREAISRESGNVQRSSTPSPRRETGTDIVNRNRARYDQMRAAEAADHSQIGEPA